MSILTAARQAGAVRLPSFKIADGEAMQVYLDRGQDPQHLVLHDLGKAGKRRCTGPGCPLCAAEVPRRENWIITVEVMAADGSVEPQSLWLSKRDLGRLARVLDTGKEGGTAAITICRVDDETSTTKRADGSSWTRLDFVGELACTIGDHDGDTVPGSTDADVSGFYAARRD